ncbi:hypothetical protein [Chryseobacterium candidae]|uniref:ATP-binding protein n=1 Tax=Chryseobacterium candidae TaxID=1978493 RepID=A0ABY2R4T2_9FLAO|nr:hypothetical protein [Chryseobacterium candidae]THV57512.1 hypothetical protein EK417_15955 [Chryseobacterium candidae]
MVSILKNGEKLTPFSFYTRFLTEVAYNLKEYEDISFKLVENGDTLVYDSDYKIEPITIPLLLSLVEQLSKFYQKPIDLSLYNNLATKNVLNFLYKSDFFYIAGKNKNPYYPNGRNILKFKEEYLGDFINKDLRPEHKVRCYSINDYNLYAKLDSYKKEDEKRDYLISEYTYIVRDHFQDLLFDNENTSGSIEFYVEILAELITNGVLHSKSNTFALMFVNKFATKFSISDNGIGLIQSLKTKSEDNLYKSLELISRLQEVKILSINSKILENLNFIFETLYYSSLKDRKGLFDLMVSVVLNSNGYFRLHSENAQIIVSNRMQKELTELNNLRNQLFNIHREILIDGVSLESRQGTMVSIKNSILEHFILLYENICNKYNEDYKYSSIRFFNVKFRGVHIEVEIPNN